MRTTLFLTLASCLIVASATATEVEVKLVRFSGEIPKLETLVSLVDSKSIADVKSYSAVVTKSGEFSYKATTSVPFPSSFDTAGKPTAFGARNVGVTFSGNVKSIDGAYDLKCNFQFVERVDTILYLLANGSAIAQPVFKTLKQTEGISLSLSPSQWQIISLLVSQGDAKKEKLGNSSHDVVLVRVRD